MLNLLLNFGNVWIWAVFPTFQRYIMTQSSGSKLIGRFNIRGYIDFCPRDPLGKTGGRYPIRANRHPEQENFSKRPFLGPLSEQNSIGDWCCQVVTEPNVQQGQCCLISSAVGSRAMEDCGGIHIDRGEMATEEGKLRYFPVHCTYCPGRHSSPPRFCPVD
jgi:hypothetical protein